MRTVLFVFAGRQPNIELALPFYRRILEQNPNTEIHLWDLCRDPRDSRYLRGITGIDRLHVRTEFYQRDGRASRGQVQVWKHYAHPKYRDCLFIKADDDVVFWETDRFADFTEAAIDNPDHVVSALTVNNGASTAHIPGIQAGYEQLGIPLLDVHLSGDYAEMCHRWFADNWQTMIGQPTELIPTADWLSINCLTFTWQVGRQIANLIGSRAPETIAGRNYPHHTPSGRPTRHRVGDEGAANMQPRLIHKGFTAAHLTFGPQNVTDEQATLWRKNYAAIAAEYLI